MHLLIKLLSHVKQSLFKHYGLLTIVPLAAIFVAGCGQRKPPLPPVERVVQRVLINGTQYGSQIKVTWQMPARNAPDGSVLNISRADIYRLAEPLTASLTLTEQEFASRSTLIGSVPIQDSDFALKQKSYTDVLQLAGQPVRLRYAVRFVNDSGQRAAFSNFLLIEPTAAVSETATDVALRLSQEAVSVSWKEPEKNIDGSAPANVLGYNVYRTDSKGETKRLNEDTPIEGTEFRDEFFSFGESYTYFVRAVSLGTNAGRVESLDSRKQTINPVDTFAPDPPDAVTIAASPNTISIFFAANTAKDIAGYRIYRSTDRDKRLEDWDLLTPDLLDVTTFLDQNVSSRTTYHYYVKAVDKTGNVSGPSEIVSDSTF